MSSEAAVQFLTVRLKMLGSGSRGSGTVVRCSVISELGSNHKGQKWGCTSGPSCPE